MTYMVQAQIDSHDLGADVLASVMLWHDVGELTVPAGTKMRTVREKAAAAVHEAGQAYGEGPWKLRVLGPAAAASFTVEAETEVRLRLGEPS